MARQFRYSLDRRVVNRILVWMLRLGYGPSSYYLLTVKGRVTGNLHIVPVALVEKNDDKWLVAPYGEVDWVRNARATMSVRLSRGRQIRDYEIREVSPRSAAPILRAYLRVYPITRPYFEAKEDSPVADFVEEARTKPVFELIELRDEGGA